MNILTFDIEEWFHILDNDSTKNAEQWESFEVRIHSNMERIFALLDQTGTKATFFCLGWIAKRYPEIVKDIANRGYHIACHGHMHQLAYEQQPGEFKQDVEMSIKTLEDLTGQKITCFRAPGFSIKEKNKWAFEILHSLGIEIDCSIFPAPRAHGGFSEFSIAMPSVICYNGITMKELPISYVRILNKPVIFSGGGYFRLFPYSLIKRWTKKASYMMTYLHPRDFDHEQPKIKGLPLFRTFKSYTGLKNAERKLQNWLFDFHFLDIPSAEKNIDWFKAPRIEI